jgi:sigma-B regulation protein RsbU (phosphoserine phosphatase)
MRISGNTRIHWEVAIMGIVDKGSSTRSAANAVIVSSELYEPSSSPPDSASRPVRPDSPRTVAERPFARLARLAMSILDTSRAFVALVDGAGFGEQAGTRSPAEQAFCQRVIVAEGALFVDDARSDEQDGTGSTAGTGRLPAWAGVTVRGPGGAVVGALCVADHAPRRWGKQEATALLGLADVAAGEFVLHRALEESREQAAERASLAWTLQESLLPPWLPEIPGIDVAARYVAGGSEADVLGDFYDVFPSFRGSWGIAVGDVCGKGVPAAKSTALARYTLRAAAHRQTRPSVILADLNRTLLDLPTADPRFLTAVYATIRPTISGMSVQVSSAGHPLALVRRGDGRVHTIGRPGTVLGLLPDPELRDTRTQLRVGESLVLFTDGVTEARHPKDRGLFGDERLHAVVATARDQRAADLADAVRQAVLAFGGTPASDDTVVLVIKPVL